MLTFKQLQTLIESKEINFEYGKHDYDPKSALSIGKSGPHDIQVEYTHKYKDEDDNESPEGHYSVDFKTDSKYTGTGTNIPPEHKIGLMNHLKDSLNSFIETNKPKLLRFGVTSSDPNALQKIHQYHKFAKILASKHNGVVETNEHDNEARVRFNNKIDESYQYKANEGESKVLYHATHIPFNGNKFRPFSHFGTKDAARSRASRINEQNPKAKSFDTYSTRLRLGTTVDIPDPIEHSPKKIATLLHKHGHIDKNDYRKIINAMSSHDDDKNKYKELASHLRDKGIHTISYTNEVEDPGNKSYMITHPNQVRVLKKTEGSSLNMERGKRKTVSLE
jgi:hypothetical protein